MKRFWILLVFMCCLGALLLVACNNPPASSPTPSDETTADTTAPVTVPADETAETPTEETTEAPTEETTEAPTEETTTDYFDATRIDLVTPDTSKVIDMTVVDVGHDVYQLPGNGNGGWRYGPSYIYHADGRVDAYFASSGGDGEWDRITHRSSTDDGKTWSSEKIVVYPTPGSMDGYSCCDPAAVYFDGYYYIGYTSTLNNGGYCNNVFVARSKNPDGPFEKWNGSGWGGAPEPIVYFDQSYGYWGIGEPSFVELNGTLYIYYVRVTDIGEYTMVATADATDENWPLTMKQHGVAVKRVGDSLDVKYVEEWGKFIAVGTADRMSARSWLAVYESNDGMTFELVDAVRENTCTFLHNAGLSSRPNGHIRITEDADRLCVLYGYGENWGGWNTRLQPITLTLSSGNDIDAERVKDASDIKITREEARFDEWEWSMVRTPTDLYILAVGERPVMNDISLRDRYGNTHVTTMSGEGISFTDYDESVITFSKGRMRAIGVGETTVTLCYKEIKHVFRVVVVEDAATKQAILAETTVEPVVSAYTIYFGERSVYRPQLRVRITKGDGTVSELYVNDGPIELIYSGYDESIISINEKGVVTARAIGTTTVTVTYGTYTMQVTVTVSDDPNDALYGMGDIPVLNYESLDFTNELDITALAQFNSCYVTAEQDGARVTVKSNSTDPSYADANFRIVYQGSLDPIMTENYSAVEIVYCISPENSIYTTAMEIYIGTGSIMDAQHGYSVSADLVCDGEFHTLRIPVSHLSYWQGQLNIIRFDFFKAALDGDSMVISSISLVK